MTALRSAHRLLAFLVVPIMASTAAAGVRPPGRVPDRSAHAGQANAKAEQALVAQCETQLRAGQATLKQYEATWRQLDAEQKALARQYRPIWNTLTEAARQSVIDRWKSLEQQKRGVKAQGEQEMLAMKQLQSSCAKSSQGTPGNR